MHLVYCPLPTLVMWLNVVTCNTSALAFLHRPPLCVCVSPPYAGNNAANSGILPPHRFYTTTTRAVADWKTQSRLQKSPKPPVIQHVVFVSRTRPETLCIRWYSNRVFLGSCYHQLKPINTSSLTHLIIMLCCYVTAQDLTDLVHQLIQRCFCFSESIL